MIKYMLVNNPISTKKKNYYAVVSSHGTKNLDDIISHMIEEGSGLTRPQALAYFERLIQSVMYFANEGYSITTPLFRVRPTISGIFEDPFDTYNPKRHQINFRVTEGQRLQDMPVKITTIVKETESRFDPVLYTLIDVVSETRNKLITVGGIAMLTGKQFRINKHDPRLGLFFVPINDPLNPIRVHSYSDIKPSEIHFQIPELPSGKYRLRAQTISRNGKKIYSGRLDETLKVL